MSLSPAGRLHGNPQWRLVTKLLLTRQRAFRKLGKNWPKVSGRLPAMRKLQPKALGPNSRWAAVVSTLTAERKLEEGVCGFACLMPQERAHPAPFQRPCCMYGCEKGKKVVNGWMDARQLNPCRQVLMGLQPGLSQRTKLKLGMGVGSATDVQAAHNFVIKFFGR
jgi:hypothetical protein